MSNGLETQEHQPPGSDPHGDPAALTLEGVRAERASWTIGQYAELYTPRYHQDQQRDASARLPQPPTNILDRSRIAERHRHVAVLRHARDRAFAAITNAADGDIRRIRDTYAASAQSAFADCIAESIRAKYSPRDARQLADDAAAVHITNEVTIVQLLCAARNSRLIEDLARHTHWLSIMGRYRSW